MSELSSLKEKEIKISRFIDLEKNKSQFYTNIFLEKEHIVIKTPFTIKRSENNNTDMNLKIERFDLTKYIYLVDY
ncbi:MAG: hypothetical protein EU541_07700 [Promethearchaeota archaeon]|nr:MAG: hypothetical protein EU541_07700 [Candidatus Lokiarchaeota archaeon]